MRAHEHDLARVMQQVAAAKGQRFAGLDVLGLWGCNSWSYYEQARFRANPEDGLLMHMGPQSGVVGYNSFVFACFQTGFKQPVTGDDPFTRHLLFRENESGSREYAITDQYGSGLKWSVVKVTDLLTSLLRYVGF